MFVFRHTRRGTPHAAFQTLLGLSARHDPVTYRQIINRDGRRSQGLVGVFAVPSANAAATSGVGAARQSRNLFPAFAGTANASSAMTSATAHTSVLCDTASISTPHRSKRAGFPVRSVNIGAVCC